MTIRSLLQLALAAILVQSGVAQPPPQRALEEIIQEATRANQSDMGHPLPLSGHWNCSGAYKEGFSPEYQLQLLRQGRHILPWLEWPPTEASIEHNFKPDDPRRQKYIDDRMKEYEPVIKELARLRLPISFLATQWESNLTYDEAYFGLPADQNPNVVDMDGKIQRRVCPFGPVEPWREVGRSWTDNRFMKQFQAWYPDPPLVVLISNNEHGKLSWGEAENSPRYLAKYGKGKSDDFKRKVVGDGWIERYGALMDGLRQGLVSDAWKKNSKCVGYEAFPPVHFGRWSGWKDYSLYTPGRLDPFPLVWDGGSPSYYLHNWMALTDYTIWSPQIETMNWVFMLDEVHRERPDFWFELSTWDGDQPGQGNDKRKFYVRQGQLFTPARYEGFVQYGMWLTRPRVVREFRGHLETIEYAGAYFQSILDSVDRVYSDPVLQKFWRKGSLVPNRQGGHPYQAGIPAEYAKTDRWFLLDTNLTPKGLRPEEFDNAQPPARQTEVTIFSLALVLGAAPNREWLVFAHAPREARRDVEIRLPDYGPITVDVSQSGSFYHVKEADKQILAILKGGPASLHLDAPRFVEVGAPAALAVTESYSPTGSIDSVRWDFGDGSIETGNQTSHSFPKPGQYLVSAAGMQNGKEIARQEVPVFVGLKPEDGLVCRLLMKGALRDGMKSWVWLSTWDKVDFHFIPDASGSGNLGFQAGGNWIKDDQRGTVLELNGKTDRVEISNSPAINAGSVPESNGRVLVPSQGDRPAGRAQKNPKAQPQVLYEEGGSGGGINMILEGENLLTGVWRQGVGTWVQGKVDNMNGWHHAAVVLHPIKGSPESALELYLDGKKIADGKGPALGQHVGDINLGRSGNTRIQYRAADQPAYYFPGRIDDFRILNRSLSAAEVQALATANVQ